MIDKASAPTLLDQLQRALIRRDVRTGFYLLDSALAKTARLDFRSPYAISLFLSVTQWIDLGYRDLDLLDTLAPDLPNVDRAHLPLLEFLKLRIAEGYRLLATEQVEECIDAIDLVLRVGGDLLEDYLLFLANFWKARAHRKRGDYEHAQTHISMARQAAERAKAPKLVAVTKIHQSWLAFQGGDLTFAFKLLDEAETTLRPTGHALSLGNIQSARGRFVRRSGEYMRALGHFEAAIALYSKRYSEHPNLARALTNAAYVKRLIALDMHPKGGSGRAQGSTHAKSFKIAQEALQMLEQAGRIYALHGHQSGIGSVLVNSAYLHLETGDIDRASAEAQRGFQLGEEKRDQILMARSRTVQSSVELAFAEEQLGDQPDVALHANRAIKYADHAIELGLHTQNKRLLAEAYIARGMAASSDYFQEWDLAKDYAAKASALLSQNDRDHIFKVLANLKAKLAGATRIEETLRMWSDGQLGDKSFQQIQEEFAEIVIPKVWLQSGKNVTAVSKALRISPKKVRRILRHSKQAIA